MVFAFGSVTLGRALMSPWPACKLVLEGFIVDGIPFTCLCLVYTLTHELKTFGAWANIVLGATIGAARGASLLWPSLVGFDEARMKVA